MSMRERLVAVFGLGLTVNDAAAPGALLREAFGPGFGTLLSIRSLAAVGSVTK